MLQSNSSRAFASLALVVWAAGLHHNVQSISQSEAYKNSAIGQSASSSVSFSLFSGSSESASTKPSKSLSSSEDISGEKD
ncbi:unnamed protein product [Bathycoccus prasinos]|jgi:hypothetical protein